MVLVVNKLGILGSKIGSFHLNNDIQKLISKTTLSNGKVNKGHFGLDFWRIIWGG